jgi:hypothetical protein
MDMYHDNDPMDEAFQHLAPGYADAEVLADALAALHSLEALPTAAARDEAAYFAAGRADPAPVGGLRMPRRITP